VRPAKELQKDIGGNQGVDIEPGKQPIYPAVLCRFSTAICGASTAATGEGRTSQIFPAPRIRFEKIFVPRHIARDAQASEICPNLAEFTLQAAGRRYSLAEDSCYSTQEGGWVRLHMQKGRSL
jgi:hypothetical protein